MGIGSSDAWCSDCARRHYSQDSNCSRNKNRVPSFYNHLEVKGHILEARRRGYDKVEGDNLVRMKTMPAKPRNPDWYQP